MKKLQTPVKNKLILSFILMVLSIGLKAQTGGPGQPEFMQFQQAGTSNLVNPASGTFSYQIPLFTIGGYPMNLTYQSGIQMEDVSSMVGLGWNLNAGSIVRTLRGLPDDFYGDLMTKKYSVKPNETFGGKLGVDLELAGLPDNLGVSVGAGWGVFYNNYKGWGLEPSLSGSISMSAKANEGLGGSASLGMGISVNSHSGVDKYLSPSLGMKLGKGNDKLGISLGKTWSVNSNEGLKTSMNAGLSYVRCSPNLTRKGVDKGGKTSERSTDQSSMSILGLSSCSYLNNCFQPDIDYPFENFSGTYSGTLGFDAYYVDPSIRVTGYFSKQKLATTTQLFSAYGSMYEKTSISGLSFMDFNREKKLPYFIGESKILSIPYKTPDVFNLNGQGISMTFSVSKNDIGVVGDADAIINSSGNQVGAEVNLGSLFKAGGNFGTTDAYQKTSRWNPTNLKFDPEQHVFGSNPSKELYQQFSFKNHGEINKFNHSAFSELGDYNPIKFNLADESSITSVLSNGSQINNYGLNQLQPVRQSTINYLTADEASQIGFDKKINYYKFNDIPAPPEERVTVNRLGHHLSEISVIQPDGMKYVFGIPVYNITQVEASFNVGENPNPDCTKNLVTYTPNQDNSVNNNLGIDHFFESTTTPAYVTQFLITAVLSPNYRDITNDGITDDDLGNYVKFSYYKEDFKYNWRTPFAQNMATYNKGLRSDQKDDKGTYVYGEKELYYVRSIESKTEIAEYHYSKRTDGYGVYGENGGKDITKALQKLDYIVVYSLPDRIKNGNYATPIKTIHFDYLPATNANSLCKNTDNSASATTGKLTLYKVSFTYENSKKGKLTPYIFEYGKKSATETINPPYDIRSVNRWGYYQKNPDTYFSDCNNSGLSNIDNPYSLQEKDVMDKNAYAWNLTDITIPGGGKLKVNYEAHDYSYIQNKTAGQMFKVAGFNESAGGINGRSLYSLSNHRIYFKLFKPINNGNATLDRQELERDYIKDIKDEFMYYKFYVKLKDLNYEYITGYAKIKNYDRAANKDYAYIELEPADLDDEINNGSCNPILKSALQFMRINRNGMVFNNDGMGEPGNFSTFINSLPNIIDQLGNQIEASEIGVNLYCKGQGYCSEVDTNKSFIRLYNPIKKKIAGGSRVKQISIDDSWDEMTGNTHDGKAYTTDYDYTTTEITTGHDTMIISSGVADYEPMVGGDEISLKQPIFYSDKKKKAPDTEYYVEEPVNESLFPAPQITYGKVTQITNRTNLIVGKTGKIVNEFYTAKDFPVKVNRTAIDEARHKTEPNIIQPPFVAIDQQSDFASVTQGYSIELNNMSGMPKATWVYNQNGDRISGEVSEYFSNNDHFTIIDDKGTIKQNTRLGLSIEYTIDGRKSYDKSVSAYINANLNMAMFGPAPIPIIMPLYSEMTEEKQFQSLVINKVIHRNGLLKSKTVYEQSSCVATENLAFDEITGEVLLTKMANEFNDTLFSFKYPAWWMYEGMGPSYINTKLKLTNSNLADIKPFLKVGDELQSAATVIYPRLWVKSTSGTSTIFMNDVGTTTTALPNNNYQIVNSAAKNILSSSAGQVVTWNLNPLSGGYKILFGNTNTLNSSAIEYYDSSVMYCDSCEFLKKRFGKNEFLSGKKGNYKPKRTWFYLEERTPDNLVSGVTNIKVQGLFKNYSDFWGLYEDTIPKWTIQYPNWEWKEKVNLTDVDGQTIETEDRIGIKTANLLGYKNTLITAQANNAAYGETYFDGFEDYYFTYCPLLFKPTQSGTPNNDKMKRVRILSGNLLISNSESHTGKYSIEVPNFLTFTVFSPKDCKRSTSSPGTTEHANPVPIISTTGDNTQSTAPLVPVPSKEKYKKRSATIIDTFQIRSPAKSANGTIKHRTVSITPVDTVCNKCIGGFFPEKNKEYVFSCWVKVNKTPPILSCNDASVSITCSGSAPITFIAEGPVIEDWQRIMGTFKTSTISNSVTVKLNKGSASTYFDDLRIFPKAGNMVSYVYDDVNLKLTYSLDENNYFTKNEYNNQGELIRIKKETEKGIITIKEGFSSLLKLHNYNGAK